MVPSKLGGVVGGEKVFQRSTLIGEQPVRWDVCSDPPVLTQDSQERGAWVAEPKADT